MGIYSDLDSFLSVYKKNTVMFCVANYGIREMTLNLVKSCKKNNLQIKQLIVLAKM